MENDDKKLLGISLGVFILHISSLHVDRKYIASELSSSFFSSTMSSFLFKILIFSVLYFLFEVNVNAHFNLIFILLSRHEWEIFLPLIAKPEVTSKEPANTDTRKLLKILHFSDTHWDPYYAEGSNALCDEPMCCRETSGPVLHLEDRAGYWGDYRYVPSVLFDIS